MKKVVNYTSGHLVLSFIMLICFNKVNAQSTNPDSATKIIDINFYTYNAKAYPNLLRPHELLISYNLNSFNFGKKIVIHPYHLRPRFITVKY